MASKKLVFPKFDDIKVSTKTFTASTNIKIDLYKVFKKLPITPYVVIPKKRGRKKKSFYSDPNKNIKSGSIITLDYEGEMRGVKLKVKKPKLNIDGTTKKKKWFRNSISVVIIFDKKINFKICKNGTFQMTGCLSHRHAEMCVQYVWNFIKHDPTLYKYKLGNTLTPEENTLVVLYVPSMRNIDFPLNFLVDREKLNQYILMHQQKFHCLLEPSFGYTGVNVKIPLVEDITKLSIVKKTYAPKYEKWVRTKTTYQEYLDSLSRKEANFKLNKQRYNTFLVFHSGKVIMSGLIADYMRNIYYYFLGIIKESYEFIEERLETSDFRVGSFLAD